MINFITQIHVRPCRVDPKLLQFATLLPIFFYLFYHVLVSYSPLFRGALFLFIRFILLGYLNLALLF